MTKVTYTQAHTPYFQLGHYLWIKIQAVPLKQDRQRIQAYHRLVGSLRHTYDHKLSHYLGWSFMQDLTIWAGLLDDTPDMGAGWGDDMPESYPSFFRTPAQIAVPYNKDRHVYHELGEYLWHGLVKLTPADRLAYEEYRIILETLQPLFEGELGYEPGWGFAQELVNWVDQLYIDAPQAVQYGNRLKTNYPEYFR